MPDSENDAASIPSANSKLSSNNEAPKSGLVGKIGDIADYGIYNGKAIEWQAIAVDLMNAKAVLITKDCIATTPYHSNKPIEATWETCTLRTW